MNLSFTVAASPRAHSLGAAALRVAADLGIKTLAFVNDAAAAEGQWDHKIVVPGNDSDITLMPECHKDIFGNMSQICGHQSVLLAYGGGLRSMAEAWSDYRPVFFEDKFMDQSEANNLKEEFLKNTYIRRMAFAHRNGYELGNGEMDEPWFFDKNNRREHEHFRPDERHWFVKLSEFLGMDENRWSAGKRSLLNC